MLALVTDVTEQMHQDFRAAKTSWRYPGFQPQSTIGGPTSLSDMSKAQG